MESELEESSRFRKRAAAVTMQEEKGGDGTLVVAAAASEAFVTPDDAHNNQLVQTVARIQNFNANFWKLFATPMSAIVLFAAYFVTIVLSVQSNYESDPFFVWVFAADCTLWPLSTVAYLITLSERLRQTDREFIQSLRNELLEDEFKRWRPHTMEGFAIGFMTATIMTLIAEVILFVILWTFPQLDVLGSLCDLTVQCGRCTSRYPCPGARLIGDVRWQLLVSTLFRFVMLFVMAAMYIQSKNIVKIHSPTAYQVEATIAAKLGVAGELIDSDDGE